MAPLRWLNNETTDKHYLIQREKAGPIGKAWDSLLFFSESGEGDYTQVAAGESVADMKRAAQVHHDSRRPSLLVRSLAEP
jgi:hypothetical protein